MFCKACGNEVVATAVICPKCGSATGGEDPAMPVTKNLLIAGWLCAVFLPFVGLILGIIVTVKKSYGHGIGMIVASLCMWMFWASFMVGFLAALN